MGLFELVVLLVLSALNGIFAMSEVAVVASRRIRLKQAADKGDKGAQSALELSENPARFLSTVQIFITLIGIISGAFAGATLAEDIARLLDDTILAPYGNAIGFTVVVLLTSYLSLIVGELVPKQIALSNPERVAARIARPMKFLARLTAPVVWLLERSSNLASRLLGVRAAEETISEAEVTAMISEGVRTGVFEAVEQRFVSGIFRMSDQRISMLMTPRTQIQYLDLNDTPEEQITTLAQTRHTRLPVCEGGLDHLLGFVDVRDLLGAALAGKALDIRGSLHTPVYVPESLMAVRALELFRETAPQVLFVTDEYGSLTGLITARDMLNSIDSTPRFDRREDGSWLLDGDTPIDMLEDLLDAGDIPGAHEDFELLSGFMMARFGHIPHETEAFEWKGYRFEVVDMDGRRIDKVLVAQRN
jgi:putative hemolysin